MLDYLGSTAGLRALEGRTGTTVRDRGFEAHAVERTRRVRWGCSLQRPRSRPFPDQQRAGSVRSELGRDHRHRVLLPTRWPASVEECPGGAGAKDRFATVHSQWGSNTTPGSHSGAAGGDQPSRQGLSFSGCSYTEFTNVHHIVHWVDGGLTNLDNLVTLCGRHHRAVHELGWTVSGDANGVLTFTSPHGHSMHSAPSPTWRPSSVVRSGQPDKRPGGNTPMRR